MRPLYPVCVIASLLLGCGEASAPAASAQPAENRERPAIPVETERVQTMSLTRRLTAVGSLQSDESIVVTPEISGRIVRIGFNEGERVQQGQELFRLDDAIDRAELAQAEANQALARRTFERSSELAQRKLISTAEVDNSRAALAVADAAVALAAARFEKTRILAPFAGVVGLRTVSLGSYVNPGDALVNLEAIDTMKVEFRVPENALARLAVGQALDVELDALPEERFTATVYALNPRASESTRSIALRARMGNEDGRLRPGLFARITLELDTREAAVVVSESAVFPRGDQNYVYAVEQGKARLQPITLGQREPGKVEVLSGLSAGEEVIVSGLQRVSPGAAVTRAAAS
jgi:membrane fusion protein (multidrug efflux system)